VNRRHLKTETESSLRNTAIQIKDTTMDNVQNCDNCVDFECLKNFPVVKARSARKIDDLAAIGEPIV
jgi:hypothetical protein